MVSFKGTQKQTPYTRIIFLIILLSWVTSPLRPSFLDKCVLPVNLKSLFNLNTLNEMYPLSGFDTMISAQKFVTHKSKNIQCVRAQANVSEEDRNLFDEYGFLVLRQLFDVNCLLDLRDQLMHLGLKGDLNRFSAQGDLLYNVYDLNEIIPVFQYLEADNIRSFLREKLFLPTKHFMSHLFSASTATRKAYPWHYGFQSFFIVQPEDPAFTMWIPLNQMNNQNDVDLALIPRALTESNCSANFSLPATSVPFYFSDCSSTWADMQHYNFDFELGDVLFFNKWVVHKSLTSALTNRHAIGIRFHHEQARYQRPSLTQRASLLPWPHLKYLEKYSCLNEGDLLASAQGCGSDL